MVSRKMIYNEREMRLLRIGIFYDGNYFYHVSNYYCYGHPRKSRLSIPGIHEVLRRQGLLPGILCLNPAETLSPGQAQEISRVHDSYPALHDDDFVAANLEKWLAD